jgi:hypothetical protein
VRSREGRGHDRHPLGWQPSRFLTDRTEAERAYVLAGDRRAEARSFASTCHGAGRSMSRTRAKKFMSGPDLRRNLEAEGLVLAAGNWKLLRGCASRGEVEQGRHEP